ncbi:MAG: LysE family translocator [Paracoccaceae bacterium]
MLDSAYAFAATSVLIELTPGPNMAYLAMIAATEGRRPGYAAVAGVALGLLVMGLLAAMGLAVVVQNQPWAYQLLRWGGVAYLLWLAWDGWRGAGETVEHAPPGSTLTLYFRRGLITNLLNPKAAIFYVTVLPEFLSDVGGLAEPLILTAIYVGAATGIHAAIVTAAGSARVWLEDPARTRRVRRGLAAALVGVAAWVLWKS